MTKFSKFDVQVMNRLIKKAEGKKGFTGKNPTVAAAIVKEGRILAEGVHEGDYKPHAEIVALNAFNGDVRGSTLYVTLEPCTHYGKTGPCVEAIVKAGIQKVIYAVKDPNPLVRDARSILEEKGIEVCSGLLEREATQLNEVFFTNIRHKRSFVHVKMAQSLDGKIALSNYQSRSISGEKAKKWVHDLRQRHDAILVGSQTVMKDNPELTARYHPIQKQPVRIILDRKGETPLLSKVVQMKEVPTWIVTNCPNPKWPSHVQVMPVLPLPELLKGLYEKGIKSILVEGGSGVVASFMQSDCVDKISLILSPMIIGDNLALSGLKWREVSRLDQALRLHEVKLKKAGDDFILSGYVRPL